MLGFFFGTSALAAIVLFFSHMFGKFNFTWVTWPFYSAVLGVLSTMVYYFLVLGGK